MDDPLERQREAFERYYEEPTEEEVDLVERARRNAKEHDSGFNPSALLNELADCIDRADRTIALYQNLTQKTARQITKQRARIRELETKLGDPLE